MIRVRFSGPGNVPHSLNDTHLRIRWLLTFNHIYYIIFQVVANGMLALTLFKLQARISRLFFSTVAGDLMLYPRGSHFAMTHAYYNNGENCWRAIFVVSGKEHPQPSSDPYLGHLILLIDRWSMDSNRTFLHVFDSCGSLPLCLILGKHTLLWRGWSQPNISSPYLQRQIRVCVYSVCELMVLYGTL